MHVVLDTNGLFNGQAGVARYIRGLLTGFQRLAPNQLILQTLAWEVPNLQYQQPQRALKTLYRELFWASFTAPQQLRRTKPDLFHSTASILVKAPPGMRRVATLHDLALLRHPERYRPWQRHIEPRRLARLHQMDQIVCDSQFTADEAIKLLNLPAIKLSVVHAGCDFHPEEGTPPEATPEFQVPTEFFLFVGSIEPGKNLALLRAAYELAATSGLHLPPLLIVGARWPGVAAEGAPPTDWHYLGRQSDAVLAHLYRRALALVFPSKYEGFGFPVAEAMSLGCPVICSRVASVPEVGGDAAVYAELEPGAYLNAMRQLHSDSALRQQLKEAGLTQAQRFSWSRCAQGIFEVYRHVLS